MILHNNSETTQAIKEIREALSARIKVNHPEISANERDYKVDEILKIHGLHPENFNVIARMEEMIDAEIISDKSIDDNSNKGETGVGATFIEAVNSQKKLIGYRYLYRSLKKLYGKSEAKRLTGMMYDYSLGLADSSQILLPYCWAGDFSMIVLEGRAWGQLHSKPPKTLRAYISALIETVHTMSNHTAGAIAIASFFTDSAKMLMDREGITLEQLKDPAVRKYIENSFQSFVHSMNSLTRSGSAESPFTNLSIFDKPKNIQKAIDLSYYFDKTDPEYIAEFLMEIQRIYMDFFSAGDPTQSGIMYRFPVSTINITKDDEGNIIDKNFLDEIVEQEIFRYNIFVSENSKDASCCFDEDTPVLIKDATNGVQLLTIKEIVERPWRYKSNLTVFQDGSWNSCKTVKVPRNDKKMFEIITKNKKRMLATEDHLFPVLGGKDKRADELTEEDYLLFNTSKSYEVTEHDMSLTYEQGILIGAYLGDGSIYRKPGTNSVTTVLSMNEDKVEHLSPFIEQVGKGWLIRPDKNNVIKMNTSDKNVADFIDEWVSGGYCNVKRLNLNALQQTVEFRQGILDGIYATDGGNSNRIYTTSEGLRDDLEALCTTLGLITVIDQDDRRGEVRQFRDEPTFTPNFVVQCIRWYTPKNKRSMQNVYRRYNGNMYFKIDSIREVEYDKEYVYCFEITKNDEPYFTLPNGVVTHNCRMLSSEEMLSLGAEANSFGGGGIGRLGSHRVVTLDYFRIAKMKDTLEEYLTEVTSQLDDSCKVLKAHRELILYLEKKGKQPFITRGYIDMTRMFSTFGVLGIVEAGDVAEVKYKIEKNLFIETVLKHINKLTFELAHKYSMPVNVEEIPAESFSHRIPNVNKILLGEENVPYELFSNQFIPMWEDATIWERMEADGRFNKFYTGGGIVHFSLSERTTPSQNKKIIQYAISTGCEHFSLNPVYSVCKDCGSTTFANLTQCNECASTNIVHLTRTVGFFTEVETGWSKPKREHDFKKRVYAPVE